MAVGKRHGTRRRFGSRKKCQQLPRSQQDTLQAATYLRAERAVGRLSEMLFRSIWRTLGHTVTGNQNDNDRYTGAHHFLGNFWVSGRPRGAQLPLNAVAARLSQRAQMLTADSLPPIAQLNKISSNASGDDARPVRCVKVLSLTAKAWPRAHVLFWSTATITVTSCSASHHMGASRTASSVAHSPGGGNRHLVAQQHAKTKAY
ncbi:hypothetical protein ERJ75_000540400 [Trypanosoma vivax]|nr:hypothetical protein ERJ75_000540400 [Trypanosoma vivax]